MKRFLKPVSKYVNDEHIAISEAGGVDEQQLVEKVVVKGDEPVAPTYIDLVLATEHPMSDASKQSILETNWEKVYQFTFPSRRVYKL